MRVLVIPRNDSDKVPGGDVVQIGNTMSLLGTLGIESIIATCESDLDWGEYDVVHFFHLPAVSRRTVQHLLDMKKPVVLSPVFWDTTSLWYEAAVTRSRIWRQMRRLGIIARPLYIKWQNLKRRAMPEWQERRWILLNSNVILPNSELELQHLSRYFAISSVHLAEKTMIVPNGVDPDLFRDVRQSASEFAAKFGLDRFILEVARIESAKSQLALIRATGNLDYSLVFIGGDSPYEPGYAAECRDEGVKRGSTFFLGKLPQSECVGAYACASAHVLPSWRETPGLSSLEAAAAGCRVVTTDRGSAREYFGNQAWYCNPEHPHTIEAAIREALASPVPSELRHRVFSEFTWERAAKLTALAYQKAVGLAASTRRWGSGRSYEGGSR